MENFGLNYSHIFSRNLNVKNMNILVKSLFYYTLIKRIFLDITKAEEERARVEEQTKLAHATA